ncbi:GntR family transcriptional regulator [Devosia algicola]|uniref:GntR family transcriptional regulator n=1 Tax=Devosia algicola TaxID=3026418 RepID=A0ABY7YQ95_9HYPH|nr:GntR family transcriptional regulator [Devosia algicola]WDR03488.1 GntR family transcriptional regulator [Devosia algicola]
MWRVDGDRTKPFPSLQLSEELGVSRTPVREAVKILAAEGLLQVRPRSGASIKIVNPQEVKQLFEAAGAIETAASKLAIERASEAEIARIVSTHNKMVAAYRINNRATYFEMNQKVHSLIVAAAHNAVLADVHEKLLMRMRRIRYACTNDAGGWKDALGEHEEMLDALKTRDGERLATLLAIHMEQGWQRVRDFVKKEFENS